MNNIKVMGKKRETEKTIDAEPTTPVSYTDLMHSLQKLDGGQSKTFDRAFTLCEDLKLLPQINQEEIEQFFEAMKSKVENNWIQFLTKVSLDLNPAKHKNDKLFVNCIEKECSIIAEDYNLSYNNIKKAEDAFFKTQEGSIISNLLSEMECVREKKGKSATRLAIAALVFVPFSMDRRQRGFENYQTQIIIDRAVTEFITDENIFEKENAGRTLGTLLSAKAGSIKKISELAFLYSGTTEKTNNLENQIINLKKTNAALKEDCMLLQEKIKVKEAENSECKQRNSVLEAENKALAGSCNDARAMLDFETHKFENLLKTREEGIAERYYSSISLELEAIKELCNYIGESDQKRIMRRIDRISSILLRNRGN